MLEVIATSWYVDIGSVEIDGSSYVTYKQFIVVTENVCESIFVDASCKVALILNPVKVSEN